MWEKKYKKHVEQLSSQYVLSFPATQVYGAGAQQELLHRLPLPRLHHFDLLPAQQDCVRHRGRHHCCPAQESQIVSVSQQQVVLVWLKTTTHTAL